MEMPEVSEILRRQVNSIMSYLAPALENGNIPVALIWASDLENEAKQLKHYLETLKKEIAP
jgi:hypothetical protein